jgi:hypothetical protein
MQRLGYVGACGIPRRLGKTPGLGTVVVPKGDPGTKGYTEDRVTASNSADHEIPPGSRVVFVGLGNRVEMT